MKFRGKLFMVLVAMLVYAGIAMAEPLGLFENQFSSNTSTRYESNLTAEPIAVQAGNVTDFGTIQAKTVTSYWAGFYGNLTANIVLADTAGDVMYDWNSTNPAGEIYAANNTVNWNGIQCFNYTATGDFSNQAADIAEAGAYNLYGLNLSTLEQLYNINYSEDDGGSSADGVNTTFDDNDRTHQPFTTNGWLFSANECPTTYVYDNTQTGVVGSFEEVLLWDPVNSVTVFTSLLMDNKRGFDGATHDFEIMVLEDGYGESARTTTSYYFYVELT